tara:strand:- start:225 stop:356 length:132 start_codon:yes stop_codon:yes gene_type:complete
MFECSKRELEQGTSVLNIPNLDFGITLANYTCVIGRTLRSARE